MQSETHYPQTKTIAKVVELYLVFVVFGICMNREPLVGSVDIYTNLLPYSLITVLVSVFDKVKSTCCKSLGSRFERQIVLRWW